jgi:hypothetical protein
MIMTPRMRLFVLTTHVTSSVGLLGAVTCFLALALIGMTSHDADLVRAIYVAMDLAAWVVIVPLAFASLFIGIIQSLGSRWGLFRHYWVVTKLLLTLLTVIVLMMQMEPIDFLAREAADATLSSADWQVQLRLVLHAAGGLLVLVILTILSVYKPRGMTRYGLRRQREERALLTA